MSNTVRLQLLLRIASPLLICEGILYRYIYTWRIRSKIISVKSTCYMQGAALSPVSRLCFLLVLHLCASSPTGASSVPISVCTARYWLCGRAGSEPTCCPEHCLSQQRADRATGVRLQVPSLCCHCSLLYIEAVVTLSVLEAVSWFENRHLGMASFRRVHELRTSCPAVGAQCWLCGSAAVDVQRFGIRRS